jgi:hypothetical protein
MMIARTVIVESSMCGARPAASAARRRAARRGRRGGGTSPLGAGRAGGSTCRHASHAPRPPRAPRALQTSDQHTPRTRPAHFPRPEPTGCTSTGTLGHTPSQVPQGAWRNAPPGVHVRLARAPLRGRTGRAAETAARVATGPPATASDARGTAAAVPGALPGRDAAPPLGVLAGPRALQAGPARGAHTMPTASGTACAHPSAPSPAPVTGTRGPRRCPHRYPIPPDSGRPGPSRHRPPLESPLPSWPDSARLGPGPTRVE